LAFTQTYQSVTNVYNVEGTLVLTAQSKPDDLAQQIAAVRAALAAEPALDAPTRAQAAAELDKAEAASKAEKPDGTTIKGHLESAGKMLTSAASVASGAATIAKTLFALGTWAAAVLL